MTELEVRCFQAAAIIVAVIMPACCGCGDSSLPLAPVSGTVTYEGEPLEHGQVVFSPIEGTPGPQAIGNIEPNGTFQMRTLDYDGAALGKHKVTVHCRAEPAHPRSLEVPPSLIPSKYSSQEDSPLRFEVTEGKNEFPIELH